MILNISLVGSWIVTVGTMKRIDNSNLTIRKIALFSWGFYLLNIDLLYCTPKKSSCVSLSTPHFVAWENTSYCFYILPTNTLSFTICLDVNLWFNYITYSENHYCTWWKNGFGCTPYKLIIKHVVDGCVPRVSLVSHMH